MLRFFFLIAASTCLLCASFRHVQYMPPDVPVPKSMQGLPKETPSGLSDQLHYILVHAEETDLTNINTTPTGAKEIPLTGSSEDTSKTYAVVRHYEKKVSNQVQLHIPTIYVVQRGSMTLNFDDTTLQVNAGDAITLMTTQPFIQTVEAGSIITVTRVNTHE